MATMPLKLKMMRMGDIEVAPPRYGREGDSGLDLVAVIRRDLWDHHAQGIPWGCSLGFWDDSRLVLHVDPGAAVVVPCGWAFEIPPGFEGQVRPRSGWTKKQIHVALGTIDSNYRGEIGFCVENRSRAPITIQTGDRMAQIIIAPVLIVAPEVVVELTPTDRGDSGFGSSGTR